MKKIVLILMLILPSILVMAQRDKEWNDFLQRHNFKEYRQKRNAQFQAYKDSINREFAKAMEQRWENYQVFVGQRRPSKPEPDQLPVAPRDTTTQEPAELPVNEVIPLQKVTPEDQNEQGYLNQPSSSDSLTNLDVFQNVDVNFYMQHINFNVPVSYEQLVLDGISEKAVAKFWADLASGQFETCVSQCQDQKKQLHLNDWALYDMIVSMAAETFPKRYSEQTILSVFVMNQLGLEAKIGRTNNQLIILMPAQSTLYTIPYVMLDDQPYYIFSLYPQKQQSVASISTYPVSFPSSTHPLDMNIYEPISFVRQPSAVTYTTDFWGDEVPFQVNQNAMDFYSQYPQVDIVIYANAEMSDELKTWSEKQILPVIQDLKDYEAVSVLLYYVQTAFEYATDPQQFGFEKPFFCEENFYYAKNDCEDRAILLSYLVRNLVGSPIVLLDYPDHIATAVAFADDTYVTGDYYQINNRKYYVCDPTYIGANVGEAMPQYRKTKADILMLKGN